ncbi:MAG: HNH endonuclease, partial [Bdellovibrionota bacterium]
EEKKAPVPIERKLELWEKVKGLSKRKCEKVLAGIFPEDLPKEKIRALDQTHSELRLVVSAELEAKLDELRNLFSHQLQDPNSKAELIELMANKLLEKKIPRTSPGSRPTKSDTRYVRAEDRRALETRSGGRCEYEDLKTGKRCESRFALQVDHVVPYGQGGKTELENLRICCRQHNQFLAVQSYGDEMISRYSGRPTGD